MRSKPDARVFAALGDETRLRLASRLAASGPMSVTQLASGSRLTRQGVDKHLRVLEKARLLHRTRRGRESVCELDVRALDDARRSLDAISQQWDRALGRLRAFVEDR